MPRKICTILALLVLLLFAGCCRKIRMGHDDRTPVQGPEKPSGEPDADTDARDEDG